MINSRINILMIISASVNLNFDRFISVLSSHTKLIANARFNL